MQKIGAVAAGVFVLVCVILGFGGFALSERGTSGKANSVGVAKNAVAPAAERTAAIPGEEPLEVPEGIKLLVFSPHPDDETLAVGGLIQRVLARGGQVKVVFVTNGDGYMEGILADRGPGHTSSGDFIDYGNRRHDEAVRAIGRLGVAQADGLFFGYPDTGVDDLWDTNWSRRDPFTSPFTRLDFPRYKTSFERWVRYDGVDLDLEMQRVIRRYRPDWIAIPDPRDYHPDHSATGVFALDALYHLGMKGSHAPQKAHVFTYLVHYPFYPISNRWASKITRDGVHNSPIAANVMARTQWMRLDLTQGELDRKKRAESAYVSQWKILGDLFVQMAHPVERFGRMELPDVMTVAAEVEKGFQQAHTRSSRHGA